MSLKDIPSIIPKNLIYTLKRHFSQFHKIQYISKVSFQETSFTISQILIYTINVFWIWFYIECISFYNFKKNKIGFILNVSLRNTFHNSTKFNVLKLYLQETFFTISQILIYTTSVSWIWFYIEIVIFYNFKKIKFILKVSLKETFSTILQISIFNKGVLNFNFSFNFHIQQFHKF